MGRFFERTELVPEVLVEVKGRNTTVFGYGNQGRAQALNLRDSGFRVTVANTRDSYLEKAVADGFEPVTLADGASTCDTALLLLPDEVSPRIYQDIIAPNLKPHATLVFASGYNVFYGLIKPREDLDCVLMAPRMIGASVRKLYRENKGFPVLGGVERDASGRATQTMLALCDGIGGFLAGGCVLESSFREETLTDLMGEQALAGSLIHLIRNVFEVMVKNGVSPEAALLELYASGEYVEMFEAAATMGIWGQLKLHSSTSQYGQQTRGPRIIGKNVRDELERVMREISDGSFSREWSIDKQSAHQTLEKLWSNNVMHSMIAEEKKLYRRLGRTAPTGGTLSHVQKPA